MQVEGDGWPAMKNYSFIIFNIPLLIPVWTSNKFDLDIPDHPYLFSLIAVHQFLTFSSFLVWEWTEWEEEDEWLEGEGEEVEEGGDEEWTRWAATKYSAVNKWCVITK